mmetsp:Transcript_17318/g.51983  ORF Transcript_17318/g.51983 Transcript_17318/m.51983 type:complete len:283 (+) Transcript_17318:11-859(+)
MASKQASQHLPGATFPPPRTTAWLSARSVHAREPAERTGLSSTEPIEVLRQQGAQLLLRASALTHLLQAYSLGPLCPLEEVPHRPPIAIGPRVAVTAAWLGIGRRLVQGYLFEDVAELVLRWLREHEDILQQHLPSNLEELIRRVVVEVEHRREAAPQTRVGRNELVHLSAVACQHHHEVRAVVLHQLEERVERLAAEGVLAVLSHQGIGLVHEEHAAQGALDNGLGLERGLAAVARHEGGAVGFHEVAGAQEAQRLEQVGNHAGHSGLARARVAGEHHVQG